MAEPMGFESFFEEHRSKVFGAMCLVTGNRQEAEGDHAGCVPAALGAMGPRVRARGSDRLPVQDSDERVPATILFSPPGPRSPPGDHWYRRPR